MASIEHLVDLVITTSTLLDTALQQSEQPAFALSLDGEVRSLNPAAAALFAAPVTSLVGKLLPRLVRDDNLAEQHLAAVRATPQQVTWRAEFIRAPGEWSAPYQLTARTLGPSLGAGPVRVLLWAAPVTETAAPPPPPPLPERLIPATRRVLGRDIEPLRQKLALSVLQMCHLVGVSSVTWYTWRGQPQEPLKSRTAELHLRVLDALPAMARIPTHPADLKHVLQTHLNRTVTDTELALLLGVERGAGFSWARGGPVHEQVLALTATLLRLLLEMPPATWSVYQTVLEAQAALENIDVWRARAWSKKRAKRGAEDA